MVRRDQKNVHWIKDIVSKSIKAYHLVVDPIAGAFKTTKLYIMLSKHCSILDPSFIQCSSAFQFLQLGKRFQLKFATASQIPVKVPNWWKLYGGM